MLGFKLFANKVLKAFDLSESFLLRYFIKGSISNAIKGPGANNNAVTNIPPCPFETTTGKTALPTITPVVVFGGNKTSWGNTTCNYVFNGGHQALNNQVSLGAKLNVLKVSVNTTLLPLPKGVTTMVNILDALNVTV